MTWKRYRPGDDVKLVVEPAGTIEGKIQAEGAPPPLPIAKLAAQLDDAGFFMQDDQEPVRSAADGTFRMTDLAAGSYHVRASFGTNADPDWVAEAASVSVESGKTTRGVQVIASHGGLLEVTVTRKTDHQPLAGVMVNAYNQDFQNGAKSSTNGIARLRLVPGDYQVSGLTESGSSEQTPASVELGKTNRIELEITPPRRITGVVYQSNGKPAAGVSAQLVAGFGPEAEEITTDPAGKFDFESSPRNLGPRQATPCVLIRDVEHSLAAAQDVDEDAGPLELKLAPALTLAGRAECDGKPLTNVTATVVFWTGNSGMHLSGLSRGTNIPGHFEIPALPPGRKYGLLVSAPGYGQKSTYDIGASSEAGRMELDPVELKPANLKIAGQVLDAEDKPVSAAYVNLQGESQPFANIRTDRQGRFTFEHVCEGSVQISANHANSFGNISAEAGDTNVVLRLGQTYNSAPGASTHKLRGIVLDADGKPVAGAEVAVFPSQGERWSRSGTNGAFSLRWSVQPWQMQSGSALLVVRDRTRNLAVTEELSEEATNIEVHLRTAFTIVGRVESAEGSPLTGAQVNLWLRAGNSYDQINERPATSDAQGRYEITCLPLETQYLVYATAKGRGRGQRQVEATSETNLMELEPFSLKLANLPLAGQVLNQDEKPVSGVNVTLNGEDQPDGNMVTDSKGRFRFQVCEGPVRLFASGQQGFTQATAEAGDTNVILNLSSSSGMERSRTRRVSLKGSSLPDLTSVNLAGEATPEGKPVLLCLFDVGQRPSRHTLRQLEEQSASLRQRGVALLGIQAAVTTDEIFNAWKGANSVSFPVGRITEQTEKCKWASDVGALPWLVLTDRNHRVVAEGFALEDLPTKLKEFLPDSN